MMVKSPAKINLSLDVTQRRPDGYHSVEMIMQTISLCDIIEIEKADCILVSTNLPYVPDDERNIAFRAARSFFEHTKIKGGARIKIEKSIPVGAGLGGGSTNAASVLMALNELYGARLEKTTLEEIGLSLGADVPFFFTGGACLAQALGEVLTPIDSALKAYAVIVKPEFSVSTKWVYENLDLKSVNNRPNTNLLLSAMKDGDLKALADNMKNVLESVTAKRYRQIDAIKKELKENGAVGSMMSGSGSAVFGLFATEKAAQKCAAGMSYYKNVFVCEFI